MEVGTQHLHLRSRFSACHRSRWETRLNARQLSTLLPSNMFHLELDLCRLSSFLPARCPLPSPPCRGCSSLRFYSEGRPEGQRDFSAALESPQGGSDIAFFACCCPVCGRMELGWICVIVRLRFIKYRLRGSSARAAGTQSASRVGRVPRDRALGSRSAQTGWEPPPRGRPRVDRVQGVGTRVSGSVAAPQCDFTVS